MSEQYGDSATNLFDEDLCKRLPMLDLDELMILRDIHGKLGPKRADLRGHAALRVGGFVW